MAEEMEKYLIGPMPVQQFLEDFFPANELPRRSRRPQFKRGNYNSTVKAKLEVNAYDHFVSFSFIIT